MRISAEFSQLAARLYPGGWADLGTHESLKPKGGQTVMPTLEELEAVREEVEAALNEPPAPAEVTPRQIRLALIASGISLASIEAALVGNEAARVEWDFALEIKRDHALLNAFAGSLGLTSAQVDDLFRLAATL